jgi:two-component system, OmpR family, response regulator
MSNVLLFMSNVLLIDDDVELTSLLADYLRQDGFAVTCRNDGQEGVDEALSGRYTLAVLDVMMPRMDGIEALRRIRARNTELPLLMLTARGDAVDRILGLELGADDYVTKPCPPRELSARIKAILRRADSARGQSNTDDLRIGPLLLIPDRRQAFWEDTEIELTGIEYNLLEVLARNAGRVVSKSLLSEQALGRPLERYDRSIDVHISSIRQKLPRQSDGQSWIRTVRGMGYQLIRI